MIEFDTLLIELIKILGGAIIVSNCTHGLRTIS
jgi:hypothetical protein